MLNKNLLSSLSWSFALLVPLAACSVDTGDEPVAESYELLEGDRAEARCVDRPMRRDAEERLACRAVEVRRADADGRCDCEVDGRRELERPERDRVLREVERDERTRGRDLSCACELRQLDREEARVCEETRGDDLRDERGERIDGWCGGVRAGVDDELDRCDGHGIRMVGEARLRADAEVLIRCD